MEKPKWILAAEGEIGVREGLNDVRIVEYHSTTTLKAKNSKIPWCSAFANWCMKKAGLKGTGLANARSWLKWGKALAEPQYGCVAVLKRGNSTTSGHVTFFLRKEGEYFFGLGGNQGDGVKASRYPLADVLGWRWPDGAE